MSAVNLPASQMKRRHTHRTALDAARRLGRRPTHRRAWELLAAAPKCSTCAGARFTDHERDTLEESGVAPACFCDC